MLTLKINEKKKKNRTEFDVLNFPFLRKKCNYIDKVSKIQALSVWLKLVVD